jgi:hypothetical protein
MTGTGTGTWDWDDPTHANRGEDCLSVCVDDQVKLSGEKQSRSR